MLIILKKLKFQILKSFLKFSWKNAKFLINFNEKYKNFAGTFDTISILKALRGSRLQVENVKGIYVKIWKSLLGIKCNQI